MGDTGQPRGTDRREVPQRSTGWARRAAEALYRLEVTPNQISVGSVLFAAAAAIGLVLSGAVAEHLRPGFLVMAAVCIPLRLLLNMLDGMLAVEKGMHSPVGDLYNELPDRIADAMLIGAAGYATAGLITVGTVPVYDVGVLLGFIAAVLAVLTAYVRTLGAAQGVGNFFQGPLPKPLRMWVLVVACLLSVGEPVFGIPGGSVLLAAVVLILLGSLSTVLVRLRLIAAALRSREQA
ncbi:CDP-alcohol phosphatidyltransferase family protein [Nesterenkonia aerolata]|uniref:CDP-alcohol phosphatidyltransferase family protein n=1 Tax=Nesterenkonia aerolata TaxID=3074079 RepID=A0ABU2DPI9_9MICC|nr:CDP-alcohol phosphatidyltransferase family protein [Nesterenkonia sp. LY-0111]MDR8018336.1 CDP-alcohol phosphatidyltransferase family protein [Nesterenkonia sp. LY-0111]